MGNGKFYGVPLVDGPRFTAIQQYEYLDLRLCGDPSSVPYVSV